MEILNTILAVALILTCLVDFAIYRSHRRRISALENIVARSTSTNTASPKMPTLEEAIGACVEDDLSEDEVKIGRDIRMVRRCYDYMCRQLRAVA